MSRRPLPSSSWFPFLAAADVLGRAEAAKETEDELLESALVPSGPASAHFLETPDVWVGRAPALTGEVPALRAPRPRGGAE